MTLSEVLSENLQTQNPVLDLGNLGLNGTEPELQAIKAFYWLDTLILGGYWHRYDPDEITWETQKNKRYNDSNTQIYEERQNILVASPNFLPLQLKHLNVIGYYSYQNKGYEVMSDISFLQDLPLLETLELQYYAVKDLSPLQNLPNLKALSLGGLRQANYEVIANIPNLEMLEITGYKEVQDINFVQNLSKLCYISLAHSDIPDISPLLGFYNLRHLCMNVAHDSKLENINVLSIFTELTTFKLSTQKDVSLDFIGSFTKLKSLSISGNWYKDIKEYDFLSNLTELEILSLWHGGIQNLMPLRNLSKLKQLYLSHNHIKDTTPIASLENLEILHLAFNKKIKDISHLLHLKKLKDIWLRDCGLKELHLNENTFPLLQKIGVSENYFTNFSMQNMLHLEECGFISFDERIALKNMPKLKSLFLAKHTFAPLREIVLEGFNNLETLEITSLYIENGDYKFLKEFPKLKRLKIAKINSFEFLGNIPNRSLLEKLEIDRMTENTQVGKEYLRELQGLKELRLNACHLKDINFVQNLPLLEYLLVHQNNIEHLEGIENLYSLKKLDIGENQITDLSPIIHLKALEEVYASANQIQEIDFQGIFPKLKTLQVSQNQVKKLVLCDLPNLSSLEFYSNIIKEITWKNLPLIDTFNAKDFETQTDTASPFLEKVELENVPIKVLTLDNTKIEDFSFITNLSDTLKELSLANSNIKDFSFFKYFPNKNVLTDLDVSQNPIDNISFVEYLPNLNCLNIAHTQIKHLKVFDMRHIKKIIISLSRYNSSIVQTLEKVTVKNSRAFKFGDDSYYDELINAHDLPHVEFEADEYYYTQLKSYTEKVKKYTVTPNSKLKLIDLSDVRVLYFQNIENQEDYFDVDTAHIVQHNSNVKFLSFNKVNIKNMHLLTELPCLENLQISYCIMDDFVLPLMPNLKYFYISGMWDREKIHLSISDSNTPFIERIGVGGTHLGDVRIENLKHLKELNSDSQAVSLSIRNCEVLEEMELELRSVNQVYIEKLPSLRKLKIKGGENSWQFIGNLTAIEDLRLENCTKFKGIESIKSLHSLKHFSCGAYFSYNIQELDKIQDISFVSTLSTLEYLDLNGHRIKDITPLSNLVQLQNLHLESNQISNISPLHKLINLEGLYLDNNQIADISALDSLVKLSRFDITKNQINDISSLLLCTSLRHIEINDNQITNFEPIKQIRNLHIVSFKGNPISFPPRWLICFSHYRNSSMSIDEIEELPDVENIFNLMQSKNNSYIELAKELAKSQGWKDEDIEAYLHFIRS